MPMWSPPTPPQEQDDVYMDQSMGHLYQETPLLESQLPPVYVKKELKRPRAPDLAITLEGRRSIKMSRREESPVAAPRSLFDHPSSTLHKMRRDVKVHKYHGTPSLRDENTPEWTIQEDEQLLRSIEELQALPTNLAVMRPAHIPNWDLAADIVNTVSCTIRSPAHCRDRYETVMIPREEGKIVYDMKKQKKKVGGMHKVVTSRPLRTRQLVEEDNNAHWTELHHARSDVIKTLAHSRKPAPKPLLVNPLMKNPKHAAVLAESGIEYETPLNPIEIASRRADRIAKDKKLQVAQAAQAAQVVQTLNPEQVAAQQRQQQLVAAKAATNVTQPLAAPPVVNVSVSTVVSTQSLVVAAGSPLNSVMQTTGITTLSPALRQPRPQPIQEMVVARPATPTVVSVSSLTSAQLQARIATGSLVSLPATAVKAGAATSVQVSPGQKTLSTAQVSYYRQQAILRQQTQRMGQQQLKVVPGPAKVQPIAQPVQPKAQYVKQAAGVVKARQEDMAALVKQQLQRQAQKQQTITTQFLTGVPTAITIPQLKTTVAGTQQIRQLGLAANYQQLLSKQARVQTKAKPATQLIVQSQPGKATPSFSVQHIQQVIKNVQPQHMTVTSQAVPGGSQVVLAKSVGTGAATLGTRVLPGSQTPRQTIQVVPGTIRTVASVSQVSNSNLASALTGSIKVGQAGSPQQTFISQVASLPGIVRQGGVNPVRIQAGTSSSGQPLMAVTVQQQSQPDHPPSQS